MLLLFVIVIAFLHRVKEAIELKFHRTRFSGKNPYFWNPAISTSNGKKVFGLRIDAVTIIKLMMVFITICGLVATSSNNLFDLPIGWLWKFLLSAVVYVVTFNLAGQYVFKKKL